MPKQHLCFPHVLFLMLPLLCMRNHTWNTFADKAGVVSGLGLPETWLPRGDSGVNPSSCPSLPHTPFHASGSSSHFVNLLCMTSLLLQWIMFVLLNIVLRTSSRKGLIPLCPGSKQERLSCSRALFLGYPHSHGSLSVLIEGTSPSTGQDARWGLCSSSNADLTSQPWMVFRVFLPAPLWLFSTHPYFARVLPNFFHICHKFLPRHRPDHGGTVPEVLNCSCSSVFPTCWKLFSWLICSSPHISLNSN